MLRVSEVIPCFLLRESLVVGDNLPLFAFAFTYLIFGQAAL